MAVDGSRWQVLGRSPSPLAPRGTLDNEFFRWLTKPGSLSTDCWSTMVFVSSRSADSRRTSPMNRALRLAFPMSHKLRRPCTARTGDLLCFCTGSYRESRISHAHTSTHIKSVAAFVTLSNCGTCEFDISLGPDGGRKIFSKMSSGDEFGLKLRQQEKWADSLSRMA